MESLDLLVDNRVRIQKFGELPAELQDELKRTCTHENPDYPKWERHPRGPRPPKVIATWRDEAQADGVRKASEVALSLPRGRLRQIVAKLEEAGIKTRVVDNRNAGRAAALKIVSGFKPYDFQVRLGDAVLDREVGLWRSPQASGKTYAALYLASRVGCWTMVLAPNEPIFDQWVRRVREMFGFEPGTLGGGHKKKLAPITVATPLTLAKCAAEVEEHFGTLIVDESQFCAANSMQASVDPFRAKIRLGISNNEKRIDKKEFLTYDLFGADYEQVTREELLAAGLIVDVEVCAVLTQFEWKRYFELDDASKVDRSGKRITDPKELARRLEAQRFERRDELLVGMERDEQRMQLVQDVVGHHAATLGEQVLVMAERREMVNATVRALSHVSSTATLSDTPEFEREVARFASGDARVGVGTFKKVGTGFESHRGIARGAIVSPCVNKAEHEHNFRQYLGRLARTEVGKTRSLMYYLFDVKVFGLKPLDFLVRWFPSATLMLSDGQVVAASTWLKEEKRLAKATRGAATAEDEDGEDDPIFRTANRKWQR